MPNIFVIAGPNGAGKSTTARTLLPEYLSCAEFVNADDIARGLSAFRPESVAWEAGRLMLTRLSELARARVDFAFETTAGLPLLLHHGCAKCRLMDTKCTCLLLAAKFRDGSGASGIASKGWGHRVPIEDVRRRYERSKSNFLQLYMPIATTWEVYDTSQKVPVLVARGKSEGVPVIVRPEVWGYFTEQEP